MLMSPDVYPPNGYTARASNEQHPNNNYLPSVSYSLDHLDRLDYQVPSRSFDLAQVMIFFSLVYYYRFSHFSLIFFFCHVYPLQGPEMLSYQPNSESCLIGCYNTEETKNFHRQQVNCFDGHQSGFCVPYAFITQRLLDQGIVLTDRKGSNRSQQPQVQNENVSCL